MKSEPDVFGIETLEERRVEHWDGVRNYQARNHIRSMAVGDRVLFYHSSVDPPGVAGLARVCRAAYPDFTAWDPASDYFDPGSRPEAPRWFMVDVEFEEKFPHLVTLDQLRSTRGLQEMLVIRRGMRLSVQPVTRRQFDIVCRLGRRAIPPAGEPDGSIRGPAGPRSPRSLRSLKSAPTPPCRPEPRARPR
jgi:predicted RNA-binding protein with PUA-like domain